MIPAIKLRSTDGKTVLVDFGSFSLTSDEAHDFAFDLVRASADADNKPDHHQSHVNLRADCPLCVYEAHGQLDRLTQDECSEVLFTDGEPVSVCTVTYGTEHSHSDLTAEQAVEAGLARPYANEAYEVRDDGTIPVVVE